MKINEVETLLDLSRANIRFYEKEGLISPERKENGYRDYSESDVAKLRQIIVFRKLGISVGDIKAIFSGTLTLQDAVNNSVEQINKQIDELNGALKVCRMIQQNGESMETFDENHYLDVIESDEKNGGKFIDFCRDYAQFEYSLFNLVWKSQFFFEFDDSKKKYGLIYTVFILIIFCIIRGLFQKFVWKNTGFTFGALYPIILFAVVSVIFLPYFLLKKNHEKAAIIYFRIVSLIAIIVAALAVIFIIGALLVGLFNSIFR